MKIFLRQASQRGFSALEVLAALGLTALVGGAGFALMTSSFTTERNSRVLAQADSEFAAGMLLARNAAQLAPFVRPAALGDCLRTDRGSNCGVFGAWQAFPATGQPVFQTKLGLNGACDGSIPCVVERTMRFRWVCTATSCNSLEVEVVVRSLDEDDVDSKMDAAKAKSVNAPRMKERSTVVSIDRRQFGARAQLSFECDTRTLSMVGVDYNHLVDQCLAQAESQCQMPHAFFTVGGTADCQPDLAASCGEGFRSVALYQSGVACAGAAPPSGPVTTNTSTNTNVSTVSATANTTTTQTTTTTETSVTPEPPPPPTTWTWAGNPVVTTCPGYCDAVEIATCAGPSCARPYITCYCVYPVGCHSAGQTQPNQPGGFCW